MDVWKRWQDWGTLILGALVFMAPFAFGAGTHTGVVGTAVAIGVLMVLASLWALYQPGQQVPHYINLVLAVLLFICSTMAANSTSLTNYQIRVALAGLSQKLLARSADAGP